MPNFIFDPKKNEEFGKIRDILINSKAIICEDMAPEIVFTGQLSYLLHGYDQKVTVDFNKMAKALYNAGYREGEKTMKTTIGELIEKVDAIESVIQDLRKMDSDTTNKAADVLSDNEYFVGGFYTRVKSHVEDHITVIDSARLVSMSIVPEHGVADKNLKVRRVEADVEN